MVGLTAEGPTVGSNDGRFTLKAIVSLSRACADALAPERSPDRKLAPPRASAWRRFKLSMRPSHLPFATAAIRRRIREDATISSSLRLLTARSAPPRDLRRAARPAQRLYCMHIHTYNSVAAPGVKGPLKSAKRCFRRSPGFSAGPSAVDKQPREKICLCR